MMSVASSTTPGIGENSWSTPSIFTAVMAAPSIELNSARRNALPTVVPQPRSNGCAENRPYLSVSVSSSAANRFGFWNPFHIFQPSFLAHLSIFRNRAMRNLLTLLLGIEFDDQLLAHRRRCDVFAARERQHARFEILAIDFEPRHSTLAL